MARSRNIKPDFFKNEDLAECSFAARLLFASLWTQADCDGKLEDRPKRIKAEAFPYDEVDIDQLLGELHQFGFIDRYEADGIKVLLVTNFHKHQHPHKQEKSKGLPNKTDAEPCKNGAKSEQERCKVGTSPALTFNPHTDSLNPHTSISSEPETDSEPPADEPTEYSFPTVGKPKHDWTLPASLLSEFSDAFPDLDIPAQLRSARSWLIANKTRRKTHGGMPKFLNGWLSRSQNRCRAGPSKVAPEQTRVRDDTRDAEMVRSRHFAEFVKDNGRTPENDDELNEYIELAKESP